MEPQKRSFSLISSRHPFHVEVVVKAALAFPGVIAVLGVALVLAVAPIEGPHNDSLVATPTETMFVPTEVPPPASAVAVEQTPLGPATPPWPKG